MAKVKLVKTGQETVEVYSGSYGTVKREARTYAVVLTATDKPIGYVQQNWGTDMPGERSKVGSIWLSFDNDGKSAGVLGWSDYRADAVKEVLRAAGVTV